MFIPTNRAFRFHDGNFLDGTLTGKKGIVYGHRASVCLETQKYPFDTNKPDYFGMAFYALLKPGEKYDSHCIYRFFGEEINIGCVICVLSTVLIPFYMDI